MGQTPKTLDPSVSSAARFGAELRRARTDRGWSLAALGVSVHVSGDLLGKIEKAERTPSDDLVRRLDEILDAQGNLIRLSLPMRGPAAGAAKSPLSSVRWAHKLDRQASELDISTPAGQYFQGAATTALFCRGQEREGRIELVATDPQRAFVARRRSRGLVVGVVERGDRTQFFALATDRLRSASIPNDAVHLPQAYELDDFAMGLLWAVTNLDDALLDDDASLAESAAELEAGAHAGEALGRSYSHDLSRVSLMWLGSSYCARHILGNTESFSATPQYWTAERSGEAACGWLLFRHKLDYLQRTARMATGSIRSKRTFCLPTDYVAGLELPDRILLLLSVSLMESFGIQVVISVDDDLASVPGFVLDGGGCAILANWVNTDRIWQVDVCRDPPAIREFASAIGHSVDNDLLGVGEPHDRLRTLAEYLGIDWPWFRTRCRGFAAVGVAGFVRPRSRLLSLDGVERACSFLAAGRGDFQSLSPKRSRHAATSSSEIFANSTGGTANVVPVGSQSND
ncbi:multiprotein-bridging factor 1 family protein [Nocardia sp. NPDC058633]|uniref:helix-turn-helix domain-containing protein n=1 Tax=Nocardia sp. NPDC058633 TaxID=3346568 RepID=UPI00364DA4D0